MENVVFFEVILLDMLACCYIVTKDQPRDVGGDGHCGLQGYIEIFIERVCVGVAQGGRSCAGARGAPAEKFGLDLSTFWRYLGKKVPFGVKNRVSRARSALLLGIYCIFY